MLTGIMKLHSVELGQLVCEVKEYPHRMGWFLKLVLPFRNFCCDSFFYSLKIVLNNFEEIKLNCEEN